MAVRRLSISLSPELDTTLRRLAQQQQVDLSRLIETFLRENPTVRDDVQRARRSFPPTKKGRSVEKLLAIAGAARAERDRLEASGRVKFPGA